MATPVAQPAGEASPTAPDDHPHVDMAEDLRRFSDKLSTYLKPEEVARVESAYVFSDAAHSGQVRSSGDPYVSHPLAVAGTLADWHLDPQALTAALLHDVM